jgi:hypothetical protein
MTRIKLIHKPTMTLSIPLNPLTWRKRFLVSQLVGALLIFLSFNSTALAGIIYRVNFDRSPLGPYTASAFKADWPNVVSGGPNSRATIVGGSDAKVGHALRIFHPKGKYGWSGATGGGTQWVVKLPMKYDELYVSFWVKFQQGFDFVKGGKLHGLFDGKFVAGQRPNGTNFWGALTMWRPYGKEVQFIYHMNQPTKWGEDLSYNYGGVQRYFKPGVWHRVQYRVKMNTPGKYNGITQAWFDGVMALDRRNIRFRTTYTLRIAKFLFTNFFGGNDSTWASRKDQSIYFDDFVISTMPIPY